jgi:hypothetical protein
MRCRKYGDEKVKLTPRIVDVDMYNLNAPENEYGLLLTDSVDGSDSSPKSSGVAVKWPVIVLVFADVAPVVNSYSCFVLSISYFSVFD